MHAVMWAHGRGGGLVEGVQDTDGVPRPSVLGTSASLAQRKLVASSLAASPPPVILHHNTRLTMARVMFL